MAVPIRVISKRVGNRRRPPDLWLVVTAVGTQVLIFVAFGQLVMFYSAIAIAEPIDERHAQELPPAVAGALRRFCYVETRLSL